jgi:hypothetical protein
VIKDIRRKESLTIIISPTYKSPMNKQAHSHTVEEERRLADIGRVRKMLESERK